MTSSSKMMRVKMIMSPSGENRGSVTVVLGARGVSAVSRPSGVRRKTRDPPVVSLPNARTNARLRPSGDQAGRLAWPTSTRRPAPVASTETTPSEDENVNAPDRSVTSPVHRHGHVGGSSFLRMNIGITFLRVLLGGLFVGHGSQKLFGWFGGHGLEGTAGFFESIGLKPGKRHATLAGVSEAGGGALLVLGLFTPLGAAAITGAMVQAIRTVHGDKGPWNTEGGWELNALMIAAAVTLADVGPGPLSLDRALGTEKTGPAAALLALGAGIAGPALLVRDTEPPQAESAAEAVAAPSGGATSPASN